MCVRAGFVVVAVAAAVFHLLLILSYDNQIFASIESNCSFSLFETCQLHSEAKAYAHTLKNQASRNNKCVFESA